MHSQALDKDYGMAIIEIQPEALSKVASFFSDVGVKIVGSAASEGVVSLHIEGCAVPASPRATCVVKYEHDGDSAKLVATFRAV